MRKSKINAIAQNVIIGSVTGIVVGYNLKFLFNRIGASDLIWIMFFIIGPFIGYLSGRERLRIQKLKKEKKNLQDDFVRIQTELYKSAEKYKLLVEQVNDAIFITTSNGKFLLFNKATSLFSGYSNRELKKMNLSELSYDQKETSKPEEYLLQNGICRYETTWKKKNGESILMDINAKQIYYKDNKLMLHVARNNNKKNEYSSKQMAKEVILMHSNNLDDMVSSFGSFYDKIIQPIKTTIKTINYFKDNYPEEDKRCEGLLKLWQKSQNLLDIILKKNARDLTDSPSGWNLNEIIIQELNFLKTIMNTDTFVVQTSFAPNLPVVYGLGRNFSLALGTVIKSAVNSLGESNDELSISTRSFDNKIIIEIRIENESSFKNQLWKTIYPSYSNEESDYNNESEISMQVIEMFYDIIGAQLDIGSQDNHTVVRIRISTSKIDNSGEKKTGTINLHEDNNNFVI